MIHFNILQLWNHLYHIKRSVSRALIFFRICFLLKHRKKKTNFFFPDFKICRYSSLGDRSVGLLPLCALRQAAWPGSVNRRISTLFEVEGFLMEGKQWGMFRESFHFKTELWRWTVEEWPWDLPPPTHTHQSLTLGVCSAQHWEPGSLGRTYWALSIPGRLGFPYLAEEQSSASVFCCSLWCEVWDSDGYSLTMSPATSAQDFTQSGCIGSEPRSAPTPMVVVVVVGWSWAIVITKRFSFSVTILRNLKNCFSEF